MNPDVTGSATASMTIGIVSVACFAAWTVVELPATMMFTNGASAGGPFGS